jgi:extradiol dioxygenase family protein
MKRYFPLLTLATLSVVLPLSSQSAGTQTSKVILSQLYFNVQNVGISKKFWASLGGTPGTSRSDETVSFPGVQIHLKQIAPDEQIPAPSAGSIVNHVGFRVPNLGEALAKWKSEGLKIATSPKPGQGYVFTPDDLMRVEITEEPSLDVPIAFHHVHFLVGKSADEGTDSVIAMQTWYANMFGAIPGTRGSFVAADLPGANLTFTQSPTPVVGTKGRMLDRIGFEVVGLRQFCQKLEAKGAKFDISYSASPTGSGTAFLTDPWGTYIEIIEPPDHL